MKLANIRLINLSAIEVSICETENGFDVELLQTMVSN